MKSRALIRDRGGSVAIEFAVVAPIIILALLSAFELMRMQVAHAALQSGAAEAARIAARLDAPGQSTRETAMRETVTRRVCAPALGESGDCWWDKTAANPLSITPRLAADPANAGNAEPFTDANGNGRHDAGESFTDLNGNGAHDADMSASAQGGAGDLVIYDFAMIQKVWSPALVAALGARTTHRVSMAVRNESR